MLLVIVEINMNFFGGNPRVENRSRNWLLESCDISCGTFICFIVSYKHIYCLLLHSERLESRDRGFLSITLSVALCIYLVLSSM